MFGSPCGILLMNMVTKRKINMPKSLSQRYMVCKHEELFYSALGPILHSTLHFSNSLWACAAEALYPQVEVLIFPTHLRDQQVKITWCTEKWLGPSRVLLVLRVIGPEDPWFLPGHKYNTHSSVSPTAWRLPFPTRQKLHEDRRALTLFTVMSPVHSSEPFLSGILNKYPVDAKSASSQWCRWRYFCPLRDIGQCLGFLSSHLMRKDGEEW